MKSSETSILRIISSTLSGIAVKCSWIGLGCCIEGDKRWVCAIEGTRHAADDWKRKSWSQWSQISNRFARANTPYTGEAFDETKPTKRFTCLDAKNIYRWAMCKPLPVRGLKWMTDFHNWRNSPCILEVDLEYLKELHDLHNNLKRTCVGTWIGTYVRNC